MRQKIRKAISILLTFYCLTLSFSHVSAAQILPEKVRIGLFFTDKPHNVNTSVESFTISAKKGLRFGYSKDGEFEELYVNNSNSLMTIRKDAFFTLNGSALKEYNPSVQPVPESYKFGAFHVQIGGEFKDYASAAKKVNSFREKDLIAYPVFTGSWYVWTGFYINESEAAKDIENNIIKKLGNEDYSLVPPSATRIVLTSADNETLLLFDNTKGNFQMYPEGDITPSIININGKNYRGGLEVIRFRESDMTVINILSLDEYLYGVVPCEIQAFSHTEALKAQAVSARTYTLGNINRHKSLMFDLCSTTYCQVYRGYDSEHPRTNEAVDQTKGEIIMYAGTPAKVFYFSSSGGQTENVKNVWGSEIPYLKSVEDNYESGKSYSYNWETVLTSNNVRDIMISKNNSIGDIIGIDILGISDAGRVIDLLVRGTKGESRFVRESARTVFGLSSQSYTILTDADVYARKAENENIKTQLAGKKVITADGVKTISSRQEDIWVIGEGNNKKTVSSIPKTYKFKGKGWGHAVGMSQEGARGMADAGFTYQEILTHYYTGVEIFKER